MDPSSLSSAGDSVNQMLPAAITKTKAGWCLREGLRHITTVDDRRMFDLVQSQGPPSFYHSLQSRRHGPTDDIKAPEDCFQSLCRIIAGQQLAGKAAQAIWRRLLEATDHNLHPTCVLRLAGANGADLERTLQKPAGLSRAKARSILDLAMHFDSNRLSESFLSDPASGEEEIRDALIQVKGLGPWSCDMFILFHLEKPNVFPFGDLGVRKGVAKVFGLRGKGPNGSLCMKRDLDRVQQLVAPYHPYQSLLTYYMWRAADSKDVYGNTEDKNHSPGSDSPGTATAAESTPTKAATRKRKARTVTP